MKIVDGVHLHFIKNKKLKTNHITLRFSGDFDAKTSAKRVMVAQMLESSNAIYPTTQLFRRKLADLYGADLSTSVSVKGKVHIVDIDITFIKDKFSYEHDSVIKEVIVFVRDMLFKPHVSVAQYHLQSFEIEKENMINYLKADKEDIFYRSELGLHDLYYKDDTLKLSKYSNESLIEKESAYTCYQEFKKMISEDVIDIFIVGEYDDYTMIQLFHTYPFDGREKKLTYLYSQPYSNITQEKIIKQDVKQSVIQLGYHLSVDYTDPLYFALIVFNGMFGGFSHSKLFMEVREKEGLAYSISSQFDIFTGLYSVTTAIDQKQRDKCLKIINRQLMGIRKGRFTSNFLSQTKKLLNSNRILAMDSAKSNVEYFYNQFHIEGFPTLEDWLDKVDKVRKEDIMRVACQIKLQTLYFVEGEN